MSMATVVNNPQPAASNNGMGFLLGVILIIVFAVLFFFYGLPYLRTAFQGAPGSQLNVPSQVDVNVKQQK
jgi:hypothetical protein